MQAQRPLAHRTAHVSGNDGQSWGADWAAATGRGDWATAWAISDQVLAARDMAMADDPRLPYHERWIWDGTPVDGRRVLVRCYHGLGDTLQFARYLAPLRHRAAHVVLEVQAELAGLLHRVPGPDRIHVFDPAAPLPAADCTVEIMELAHALRLPPDPTPYLIISAPPSSRIGFCWQAGDWDAARSIPGAVLRPLAVGVDAVSLQRGPSAADLGAPDPLDGSMDLECTATLIATLRAVVTVDTMVAHLAGALGRPTHLLLKHDPDWRWGTDGLWYQTVRSYRQDRPGDWSDPIARVGDAIRATIDPAEGS